MGILDKLFGTSSGSGNGRESLPWTQLTQSSQLKEVDEQSFDRPQIIFKHSSSCGISSMVLNMFSNSYPLGNDQADLYFLDIHQNRSLSNEIASKYNVRHESPQLLIIRKGSAQFNTSHGAIADIDLSVYA